jgi:adenine-specific DNA methylase
VATAHVPQHAYGSAYYALKAIAANDPTNAEAKVAEERSWQSQHVPEKLRQEIMKRLVIQKKGKRIIIKIQKGKGF